MSGDPTPPSPESSPPSPPGDAPPPRRPGDADAGAGGPAGASGRPEPPVPASHDAGDPDDALRLADDEPVPVRTRDDRFAAELDVVRLDAAGIPARIAEPDGPARPGGTDRHAGGRGDRARRRAVVLVPAARRAEAMEVLDEPPPTEQDWRAAEAAGAFGDGAGLDAPRDEDARDAEDATSRGGPAASTSTSTSTSTWDRSARASAPAPAPAPDPEARHRPRPMPILARVGLVVAAGLILLTVVGAILTLLVGP